jgi:hypothetical protein
MACQCVAGQSRRAPHLRHEGGERGVLRGVDQRWRTLRVEQLVAQAAAEEVRRLRHVRDLLGLGLREPQGA